MSVPGGAASDASHPTLDAAGFRHRDVELGPVRLHLAEAGEGPTVVLLHGFPECWWSWRHQIVALADAGYRVLAPDLRGYNTSSKPDAVADYHVDHLAADVARLVDWSGGPVRAVVGHDWGGVVAWIFGHRYPERYERLAILNAPHPAAMLREQKRNPAQLLRSWYVYFFQLPWLPELVLSRPDLHARLFRRDGVPSSAWSTEDLEVYRRALEQPGAKTAMIDWYRASVRAGLGFLDEPAPEDLPPAEGRGPIERPVLVLWGERDRYLGTELLEGLEKWARDVRIRRFPDVSHWIQTEAPEEVSGELVGFLDGSDDRSGRP